MENPNWYEISYWGLDGEWRGCPNCDECDGERPSHDVTHYIENFYNKRKVFEIMSYITSKILDIGGSINENPSGGYLRCEVAKRVEKMLKEPMYNSSNETLEDLITKIINTKIP